MTDASTRASTRTGFGTETGTGTGARELIAGIRSGDRRMLARAITLAESTRPEHRQQATVVLDALLDRTGRSVRVGISGAPGAGKSTFIEALGTHLTTALDHTVAVLAVDPTSRRSGGSILGDKTRMERLVNDPKAFVRPSPSGGELGGVARRTREALLLCEAFGFDVVLVETVGVGQSEVAVADMTDLFVLLASPGGGDELQGIKRGIIELADVVLVTKADGPWAEAARLACADLRRALQLLRPKWPADSGVPSTEARLVSSTTGDGVADAWASIAAAHAALLQSGSLASLRKAQARSWFWNEIRAELFARFASDAAVAAVLPALEQAVTEGSLTPAGAASQALAAWSGATTAAPDPR